LVRAAEDAERAAIAAALQRLGADLTEVARSLNVSSTTLWRKMKRYGLKA
jgi:transcriptional regulator of acetoin/glycerol metabolism